MRKANLLRRAEREASILKRVEARIQIAGGKERHRAQIITDTLLKETPPQGETENRGYVKVSMKVFLQFYITL